MHSPKINGKSLRTTALVKGIQWILIKNYLLSAFLNFVTADINKTDGNENKSNKK